MNPLLTGFIGFALMLVLKGLRSPIGVGLALVGFFGVWYLKGLDTALFVLASAPVETLSRFTLAVFLLFILMGTLALRAGLAEGLYNGANALFGHRGGGLAIASIVGCGGFAAVNGSSLSTAATMTKLAVSQMLRHGYDVRLATGTVAAGGTLGIIIPPSLGMIVYAVLTETSIGKLFAAGALPGLLAVVIYAVVVSLLVRWRPALAPQAPKLPFKERLAAIGQMWGIIMIMVGEFGVVTPPVGMNVFVVAKMVKEASIADVYRGMMPFLMGDVVRLALVMLFPAIALWLPNLLFD